jgi:hypothetical protein
MPTDPPRIDDRNANPASDRDRPRPGSSTPASSTGRHRRPPATRHERAIPARDLGSVDTPLRFLTWVLGTDDPKLRFRRALVVLLVLLTSLLLALAMVLELLVMVPDGGVLQRILLAALGVSVSAGATATVSAVKANRALKRGRAASEEAPSVESPEPDSPEPPASGAA